MTDTTIDLHPANVDGRLVYIAPVPLSAEPFGGWITVLVVLALVAALAARESRR